MPQQDHDADSRSRSRAKPSRFAPGESSLGDRSLRRLARLVDRELWLRNEIHSRLDDARWMILLDVYLAMTEARDTPFMSAAHASCAPVSTAQRYIHEMTEAGLLVQHRSASHQRTTYVSLSPLGLELVVRTLREIMALRERYDSD